MRKPHWDPEARALAVLEGLTGKPVKDICGERNITAAEFGRWRGQFLPNLTRSFKASGGEGPVGRVTDVASLFTVLGKGRNGPPEQLDIAQKLIEALPFPVFFKGRDGKYLGVNKAWEDFFGVPRETFIGKEVRDLYPQSPWVAEKHHAMDQELWQHPGSQNYEIPVATREGRVRHAIYYKATFTRADGEVAGLIGTIIDITERKQAEQRQAIEHAVTQLLAESDTLAEAIRGIIRIICERLGWVCGARWSLNGNGKELHCIETWGIDDARISDFLEAIRRNTLSPEKSGLVRRVLVTGLPVWIADVTQRKDFSRASLAAQAGLHGAFALPVLIGNRVFGAIEFYSRDAPQPDDWLLQLAVTVGNQIGQLMARRQAEAAMRESEARFRSLTELSSDWYWEQDEVFRFTAMSRGVFDSTGAQPEEFIGKGRGDIPLIGLTDAELAAHKQALDTRQPFQDLEFGRTGANGRIYYVSISGQPVFDEEGSFKGYRGVGKDITPRKKAETALREAHDELARKAQELARSNDELQQFAYVASHDLQEPLRMISSYTQLLERRYASKLDDDAKEFMEFIVDGAARMKQLIEDLLAYSRVGTRGHEFVSIDCEAVLQKALVNLRAAIEASGAVITHDPLPTVTADDSQLVQLFQNFIGNAIKFRSPDAPYIHVSAREQDDAWVFAVRDNGIGIDPQYFERIFVLFQRLHSKAEYPGTGIGLAICKKIVDRHDGRIWVESQPGQGCTFFFTLPRKPEEARL